MRNYFLFQMFAARFVHLNEGKVNKLPKATCCIQAEQNHPKRMWFQSSTASVLL